MKKVISVIGARPQFIKYAPLSIAFKDKCIDFSIHSGQHYDKEMSDIFFKELQIPEPKYLLKIGSATHGVQTGKMLVDLDPIFLDEKPDAVIVFGDTNTTIAGALSAAKLNIPLIHIEAGLRSFNRSMPEELNRITTDHLSSQLFAPTNSAVDNLKNEGISANVELTGDLMADSLRIAVEYIKGSDFKRPLSDPYYLSTIHRNYNTDNKERLELILNSLNDLDKKVILPLHPRTLSLLKNWNINQEVFKNINIVTPLGYFAFINHLLNCEAIITDSGGIQKEAYMLKKPCITLRYETEWDETLDGNWNILAGNELDKLPEYLEAPKGDYKNNVYGDGYAADFIADKILEFIN